jgi:hypothetical protein
VKKRGRNKGIRRGRGTGNCMPFLTGVAIYTFSTLGDKEMVAVHILPKGPFKSVCNGRAPGGKRMTHLQAVFLLPLLITTGKWKYEAVLGPE